jgi:hypothetical protein
MMFGYLCIELALYLELSTAHNIISIAALLLLPSNRNFYNWNYTINYAVCGLLYYTSQQLVQRLWSCTSSLAYHPAEFSCLVSTALYCITKVYYSWIISKSFQESAFLVTVIFSHRT